MERLIIWLHFWAMLVDGLIGILTIGFYYPSLALKTSILLSRWRYKKKVTKYIYREEA